MICTKPGRLYLISEKSVTVANEHQFSEAT